MGLYSEGVYPGGGAYIRDVNWVTYLGGLGSVYSWGGGLIYGGRINGIIWNVYWVDSDKFGRY